MNETYKIRSLGGALVVTLPQRLVRQYALQAKDEIAFNALDKKHIVIEVLKPGPQRKDGGRK